MITGAIILLLGLGDADNLGTDPRNHLIFNTKVLCSGGEGIYRY